MTSSMIMTSYFEPVVVLPGGQLLKPALYIPLFCASVKAECRRVY